MTGPKASSFLHLAWLSIGRDTIQQSSTGLAFAAWEQQDCAFEVPGPNGIAWALRMVPLLTVCFACRLWCLFNFVCILIFVVIHISRLGLGICVIKHLSIELMGVPLGSAIIT